MKSRIEQTVKARGIVKPAPNALIRIGFPTPKDVARRIQTMKFVEGYPVKAEDELAPLDHADPKHLQVHLYVDEADFGKVRLDREVKLRVEAHAGETVQGKVVRLLPQPMGLAVAGVMAGLLLDLFGTWIGQQLMSSAVAVQLPSLVMAVVVSLFAGGMACLAPAIVAARLEPAAVLRS